MIMMKKLTTHTGETEKPFQCKLCDKTFSEKYNLNDHQFRIHIDGSIDKKVHECSQCGKCFIIPKELKRASENTYW